MEARATLLKVRATTTAVKLRITRVLQAAISTHTAKLAGFGVGRRRSLVCQLTLARKNAHQAKAPYYLHWQPRGIVFDAESNHPKQRCRSVQLWFHPKLYSTQYASLAV